MRFTWIVVICGLLHALQGSHGGALAEDSAPSSHLVFDDRFPGDIIINEVRVPKSGAAMYTYYEALGWRGRAAGYAGIQVHPKAHLYLFSIWDHQDHTAPIRAVYRGAGTETVGFGGEGTGLKSWNFKLGWDTDVWYTLVARNWPVGKHTFFGFWTRASNTQRWTHLVTMDVAVPQARFEGGTDAFIEDWSNTGPRARTSMLRGGWKRKTNGKWFAFREGRYSVNAWDLDPGKRSYNFRRNFDGGVRRDAGGAYYFMTAGGAQTAPSTPNPSRFSIRRRETEPAYKPLAWKVTHAQFDDARKLHVSWQVDPTTTPPFSCQIQLFDRPSGAGQPLATLTQSVPHARAAQLDVGRLKLTAGDYYVRLIGRDLFDRASAPAQMTVHLAAN